MGNRFLALPGYHSLIRGHGIVAAITFLLIVPAAIMINHFYTRRPARAVRYHIWLQILTLLLTTVIFILGYFAVGPQRSLTNPHHGTGLAIYVLVLVQFFGGWWVNSRERRKRALQIPLKVVVSRSASFLYGSITKILQATQMDWSYYSASWIGANTSWSYPIRLTTHIVCTLRIGRLRPNTCLFHLKLHSRKTERSGV